MYKRQLANVWVKAYRAVPRINFPFTELDIAFSLCSATFLYLARLSFEETLIRVFQWPRDTPGTTEAVGSLAAMLHAMILVPGLFVALTTQPYSPTEHISKAPQWWQDLVSALLQTCTGYMVYDSVVSFFMLKGFDLDGTDLLFLGHHLATTIYMTQTRVIQAGHTSAMICMLLGEFTNPFQNGRNVTNQALQLACCNGIWMQKAHSIIEFLFAFFYFTMRSFVAPVFFLHVTIQLLIAPSRHNISLGLRIVWILLIWAVEVGSYDWIIQCWDILQTYREGFGGNWPIQKEL